MAGFNMMDLMNGASKSQTVKPSYELREIPIGKLIPNPANAYSMDGIEELANSILIAGRVLQNLVVKPADENGDYMIISGHRRHLASKMLVEQGHNEFATVSALIENERNETLQELMLIYTNSTARVLTDAEKMRQAIKATELLKELKDKGQFNERIRDAVAKMLQTTTGQIGRYQAIANNLTNPELKEKFDNGEIGVSAAYEASRLSEEGQKEIAEQMKGGANVSVNDIAAKKKDEERATGTPDTDTKTEEKPPIKNTELNILSKFKLTVKIRTIEKDGKFYSASDVTCNHGAYRGYSYSPNPKIDMAYDTEQQAIEAEIKHVAKMEEHFHKALWESGYRIVGEPQREETSDRPVNTDNTEKSSQTGAQAQTGALPQDKDTVTDTKTPERDTEDEVTEQQNTRLAMLNTMDALLQLREGHIEAAKADRKRGDEKTAIINDATALYLETLIEKVKTDIAALGQPEE